MIMRSLSLSDPELRCNMLEVLTMILEVHDDNADKVLHAQASSMVDRLLSVGVYKHGVPDTPSAIVGVGLHVSRSSNPYYAHSYQIAINRYSARVLLLSDALGSSPMLLGTMRYIRPRAKSFESLVKL
jgi:hypothetical protein